MSGRDSAKTKARIIRAARRLFAERDIASVGIRDIASAAGVSHGLVQRYCGTREQMIAEIVRQEVERFSVSAPPRRSRTAQTRRPGCQTRAASLITRISSVRS